MTSDSAQEAERTDSRYPPDLDMSTPTVARTYDALLGGKDNFQPDRDAAMAVEQTNPGTTQLALENRGFLSRGVRYVSELGIRQFIDLGSGLPTVENTHQVAQSVDPNASVVYVDIDPIVLAHGRAILAENSTTTVVTADLRDVERVMSAEETRGLVDFSRPVGLMLVSLLHCVPDKDDPFGLVRRYFEWLPAGSALIYSHLCASDEDAARTFTERVHELGMEWGRVRSPDECARALDGLEIVSPSTDGSAARTLVDCDTWRNGDIEPQPRPTDPDKQIWEHAGVGVKRG
ncbi:SAM-dependent methyltransferase [Allosalinactinospora lopnorensis]|uniref:SAM-dependent methyltransferase n=1 Tax=Allosalinactinospora lopnorensis TaxID=1352348 RepID=UPI000AB6B6A7|nr:SAM-dependent methyltransferase [Allosalinactinospora lopnorensis]